jgi:uncharacterized membrane protein YgcG
MQRYLGIFMLSLLLGQSPFSLAEQCRVDGTKIELHNTVQALDAYKTIYGSYPTTETGIQELVDRKILSRVTKDVCGNPFFYVSHHPRSFVLRFSVDCAAKQKDFDVETIQSASDARYPARQEIGKVVFDLAGVLSERDKKRIQELTEQQVVETSIPVVVVTLEDLDEHLGKGMSLDQYASQLFDVWAIGHAKVKYGGHEHSRNRGMLILIGVKQRKMRVQFGADWSKERMSRLEKNAELFVVPKLSKQSISDGAITAALSLSYMQIGADYWLTQPSLTLEFYIVALLFIGLFVLGLFRIVRSKAKPLRIIAYILLFGLVGFSFGMKCSHWSMLDNVKVFSGGPYGSGFTKHGFTIDWGDRAAIGVKNERLNDEN